jgi:hypothetical protein
MERVNEKQKREVPYATLKCGGAAPFFITIEGETKWTGEVRGKVYSGTAETRAFHILDAIEYEVSRAHTEEDLYSVLRKFIPSRIDLAPVAKKPKAIPGIEPTRLVTPPFKIDPWLDPDGSERLAVYFRAVNKRKEKVQSLAASAAVPATLGKKDRSKNEMGCSLEPIAGRGNDPLASAYCHVATGTHFSYWIESPAGRAEIDALRGNMWYECKCGYRSMVRAYLRGEKWAKVKIEGIWGMDEQVLRHKRIAQHCGLQYRFMVSNDDVTDFFPH